MNLDYTHKPNYYFFAHRLISFLENEVKAHPDHLHETFNLEEINHLFGHDYAATRTNLEGIMHIVDEYVVDSSNINLPLIQHFKILSENHVLEVDFNAQAVDALISGKALHYPKVA